MALRGQPDEFKSIANQTESTAHWNPLLIAVANKRIDVVKYFLEELNISLKLFGAKPQLPENPSDNQIISASNFVLHLAIANRD